jgi:DNA primase
MADLARQLMATAALGFSFVKDVAEPGAAEADFAVAVQQNIVRQGLVRALGEATQRFQASLAEEDYDAQQSLRRDIEMIDAAMMRLAESRREG